MIWHDYCPWVPAKHEIYTDMGFVYLLQRADGLIKIGRTSEPDRRFRSLGIKFGSLRILRIIRCFYPIGVESSLHYEFKDFRIEGEWFDLPMDYERIIEKENEKQEKIISIIERNAGPLFVPAEDADDDLD